MATVLCGHSFDESRLFQLGEASVQRPRTELHACKAFDVFDEAIAMLWATGKTREDEDAAIRRPANPFDRHVDLPFDAALQSRYIGEWSIASNDSDRGFPCGRAQSQHHIHGHCRDCAELGHHRHHGTDPAHLGRGIRCARAEPTTRAMSAVSPTCILFMWDRKEFVAGSRSE